MTRALHLKPFVFVFVSVTLILLFTVQVTNAAATTYKGQAIRSAFCIVNAS